MKMEISVYRQMYPFFSSNGAVQIRKKPGEYWMDGPGIKFHQSQNTLKNQGRLN